MLQALAIWVASRVALITYVCLVSTLMSLQRDQPGRTPEVGVLDRFVYWDSFHFLRIADLGYVPPGLECCDQAFFPGYPLVIRLVSLLTGANLTLAALIVSELAGAVAAVILWRLAADSAGGVRAARAAVLFLSVAPFGIFLSAVYSESLFLALALAAWWAATRQRWWLAGALAGATTGVRINGLFLTAALAVMYLLHLRERRAREGTSWWPRWDALALLAPLVVLGAYFAWLYRATGSMNAWLEAESTGWSRETAWPWQGLMAGWQAIAHTTGSDLVISRWADLLTVVAGLALTAVLVALRRWPEAVYLSLNIAVLVSSTTMVSAPRYALMWFPGYLLLAQLSVRPRWEWVTPVVVAACIPLFAAMSLSFAAHQWVS
jgi:hypothetical protein